MSNHTPGPWKWVVEYRDKNYKFIQKDFKFSDNCEDGEVRLITEAPVKFSGVADAWCDRSGDYKGIEIDIADARLIAAAPDLLKALKNLVLCSERWEDTHTALVMDAARAAIDKATGEKI